MADNFFKTISEYEMLREGDSVLIGLSGGADSVCLLCRLLEIKKSMKLSLTALHVNHCIRGAESDSDEEFCRKLCLEKNIPFIAERIDVPAYAEEQGLSVEEAARNIRYALFEKHAADKIATAHTLSDSAETMLYNLVRGTAMKGLCGIPPVRGRIIRPLISTTREEVEEYLSSIGQTYVTDSTNLSDEYSRNKLRLRVLPLLKEMNPSLLRTMERTAETLRSENDFLEQLGASAYEKYKISDSALCTDLRNEHKALRLRCIALFLRNNGVDASCERIRAVDEILQSGGKINPKKDVYITAKKGTLFIETDFHECVPQTEIPLRHGETDFLGKTVSSSVITKNEYEALQNVHEKFTFFFADYDKIQGDVVLRNRRGGDKIQLSGRSFHSSLKKLFSEKVPKSERELKCILSDDNGVLFVEDFGFSERLKIDETTENIWCVNIKDGGI